MHNERQRKNDDIVDAELASIYRTTTDRAAPAELDKRILGLAAREAGGARGGFFSAAWLRPLTFAATVGISVALLLEIGEVDIFGPEQGAPPPSVSSDGQRDGSAAPSMRDAEQFQDAAGTAREQMRAVDADETASLRAMPGNSNAADAEDSADAAAAKQRIAADQDEVQEIQERIRATTAGALTNSGSEPSTERGCTPEQRQNPDTWLACITDLENTGFTSVAEAERSNLLQAFPDRPAQ